MLSFSMVYLVHASTVNIYIYIVTIIMYSYYILGMLSYSITVLVLGLILCSLEWVAVVYLALLFRGS